MCRKFYYVHPKGLCSCVVAVSALMCKMCICAVCAYVRSVVFRVFLAVKACLIWCFERVWYRLCGFKFCSVVLFRLCLNYGFGRFKI